METLGEHPELLRLHDRIAELERALADARLDLRLTRAWFRLACLGEAPAVESADQAPPAEEPFAVACWGQGQTSPR